MAAEDGEEHLWVNLKHRTLLLSLFFGWLGLILLRFFIFKVAVNIFANFANCLEIRCKAKNYHLAAKFVGIDSCLVFLVLDPVPEECVYEFGDQGLEFGVDKLRLVRLNKADPFLCMLLLHEFWYYPTCKMFLCLQVLGLFLRLQNLKVVILWFVTAVRILFITLYRSDDLLLDNRFLLCLNLSVGFQISGHVIVL